MSRSEFRYPVRVERVLDRVPRRMLLGERRDVATLPAVEPGTTLLFKVDGRYVTPAQRGHLTGKEPEVIEATAVAMVDMRPRRITASVPIPSASAADDFILRTTFVCQVTDARLVATAGLTDVAPALRQHLTQDHKLLQLGMGHTIDQLNIVRELVIRRVYAIVSIRPPNILGIAIQLDGVDLITPQSLREHATKLRDTGWQGDLDRKKHASQDETAQWIARRSQRGPDELAALAAARGELTIEQLLARQDANRRENLGRISDAISVLAERGHLDRVALDPQGLVDTLASSLGETQAIGDWPERLGSGTPQRAVTSGDGRHSDPDDDGVEAFEFED